MAAELQDAFEERRIAFVKEIEGFFSKGKTQDAFEAVHDLKNYEQFKASGFELIPIAGKYVTKKVQTENPDTFRCALQVLNRIAREFSPQETYLELLEQAEDSDDVKFVTVLDLIKSCLFRMPNQRGKSICWSCDTITRHLCNMDVPKCEETDDGEDSDLTFHDVYNRDIHNNISSVYQGIIEFFQPFVHEISEDSCEIPKDHLDEYKGNMLRCLVKSLGRPLVHIDLSKVTFKGIADSILDMVDIFSSDPFTFLKHVDSSFGCVETIEEDAVFSDYTNVSLGCYFYLVMLDEFRMQKISHVYSAKYLFECTMAMAFDLMGANEAPLILKALKLLDTVLDRMSPKSVEFNSIRDTVLSKFLEMLTRSMVHNEVKEVRQLSVKVFPKFLAKFTAEGQYMVLFNVDQLSAHPGFVGFAMTLVKERVREALDSKNTESLQYFVGKKLKDLLRRYCRISGLVEADLQSHTDQIMSCLNLIRYILLRDKNDETGVAEYLFKVEESYLEPVKKACSFARGLYEDHKLEVNKSGDRRMRVSISGGPEDVLPEMSPEETVRMMNENLTRVDMIDYLASRVSQCLIEYKQNLNASLDVTA